jgi:hypothetical protein
MGWRGIVDRAMGLENIAEVRFLGASQTVTQTQSDACDFRVKKPPSEPTPANASIWIERRCAATDRRCTAYLRYSLRQREARRR